MGFVSYTKPEKQEEAARVLHNLYFMDQALIVEQNQQPLWYKLWYKNLEMFTQLNSTDDSYYLMPEWNKNREKESEREKMIELEKRTSREVEQSQQGVS